ncbi:Hypothetical protein CINCED_3A017604 [Cinara cedri]|uniref:Uncharacterized protein n=1 Tax=Cinara cedri TaxID=506608 RepID=A0A5E4MZ43_9HEMI|nr:Hypothetical protein CINCED_3A017604 [Cinara cedri]
MKMKIFNQIQKHDDAKKMIEQKFKQMCTLDNNLSDVGGLLVKSQEYLKILDSKLEKNEKNIINKRQQIEDEHNKIKNLKIDLDIKQTSILDNQNLIKEKQSQLKDIELQCEKESKEFEKMKLQRHKNQIKMELMQSVMKHHEKETKEKIQFYHNNIIRPLELKQVLSQQTTVFK